MSFLSQVSKPTAKAGIFTISGESGIGKTSLAALFPNPVFIMAENGIDQFSEEDKPMAFPKVTCANDVFAQLTELIQQEHDFKTVVVDSVTALELLFQQDVIDSDPKKPKTIAQAEGGYGNGFLAVAGRHARVRKAAGILKDKGINVVFIAHSEPKTIDLPDMESYTRYDLKMHDRSKFHYENDVDMVAFLKLETFSRKGDNDRVAKAIDTGSRVLVVKTNAAHVSKNRFGIEQDLTFEKGVNPLSQYISYLR